MKNNINSMIGNRRNTHGDFEKGAKIEQGIKAIYRSSTNWNYLDDYHKMSLDLIALKISRICEGDFNFTDHWEDIIGYSTRTLESIQKEKNESFKGY